MKKTRVLICGVSGFIGRNLFEHFNRLGGDYEISGTYFKNPPTIPVPNMFRYDLRDLKQAMSAVKNMDIVINAAAMTDGVGVFSKENKAVFYAKANNLINANLAEAVFINGVKNFVFLSCTVMYPSSAKPVSENGVDISFFHPKYLIPAKMKLFGEERCRYFADWNSNSTKYTVIRHTNIYGPHDKFDLKRGHVLSATVEKAMTCDNEITVWGRGQESRDFLYIDDLIEFIKKAVELQKSNFEIFNAGSGKTYSVNELVNIIIACSGKKLNIVHDTTKPSVDAQMNISSEKAKRLLGWKAQIELREGILKTLKWYKLNHHHPQ